MLRHFGFIFNTFNILYSCFCAQYYRGNLQYERRQQMNTLCAL